jgi:hypothetical protein
MLSGLEFSMNRSFFAILTTILLSGFATASTHPSSESLKDRIEAAQRIVGEATKAAEQPLDRANDKVAWSPYPWQNYRPRWNNWNNWGNWNNWRNFRPWLNR